MTVCELNRLLMHFNYYFLLPKKIKEVVIASKVILSPVFVSAISIKINNFNDNITNSEDSDEALEEFQTILKQENIYDQFIQEIQSIISECKFSGETVITNGEYQQFIKALFKKPRTDRIFSDLKINFLKKSVATITINDMLCMIYKKRNEINLDFVYVIKHLINTNNFDNFIKN